MASLKKAAMFGLDARIALAIFGALSVVSGSALYSAIQTTSITWYISAMSALTKASEQYFLDNGKPLPCVAFDWAGGGHLKENIENLSTWKGPYLDNAFPSWNYDYVSLSKFDGGIGQNYIILQDESGNTCDKGDICREVFDNRFVASYEDEMFDLFTKLDEYYDNSDGATDGRVKYSFWGAGGAIYFIIRQRSKSESNGSFCI